MVDGVMPDEELATDAIVGELGERSPEISAAKNISGLAVAAAGRERQQPSRFRIDLDVEGNAEADEVEAASFSDFAAVLQSSTRDWPQAMTNSHESSQQTEKWRRPSFDGNHPWNAFLPQMRRQTWIQAPSRSFNTRDSP